MALNNHKFKAVACDLDGTLLNSNHQISPKNISTLKNLHKMGYQIVLASGRMKDSMVETWQKIGIPCWIVAYNGAQILRAHSNDWELLYSVGVSPQTYRAVIDLCSKREIFLNIYTREGLYGFHPRAKWYWPDFYSSQTGAHYIEKISDPKNLPGDNIIKLLAITPVEDREPLIEEIKEQFSKHCQIIKSNPEYTEFHNLTVNKGNALNKWQEFSKIRLDELVAFGDAENDYEMLTRAGLGIAANNATPGLKNVYHKISAYTNDEDFITRELREIFPLE